MLNIDELSNTFTINCINCLKYYYILKPCETLSKSIQIVMLGIDEEQERYLSDGKTINIIKDGVAFRVNPDYCYAYGELDFTPNSKDMKDIARAKWFKDFDINIFLLSNYDYKTHTVTSDVRGGRWYESSNIKQYLPYIHGCLGKPKRVAIFREYVDDFASKKQKQKKNKESKSTYNKEAHYQLALSKRKERASKLKFTIKY